MLSVLITSDKRDAASTTQPQEPTERRRGALTCRQCWWRDGTEWHVTSCFGIALQVLRMTHVVTTRSANKHIALQIRDNWTEATGSIALQRRLLVFNNANASRNKDKKLSYRRDSAGRGSWRRSRSFKVTDFGTNWKPVCATSYLLTILIYILFRTVCQISRSIDHTTAFDRGRLSLTNSVS